MGQSISLKSAIEAAAKFARSGVLAAATLGAAPGFAAPAPPVAAEESGPAGAMAAAVELADDGEHATLSFALSAPVEPAAFVLSDPDRVIVDAPSLSFAIDSDVGKPAPIRRKARRAAPEPARLVRPDGLVASFRFGQLDRGRARIVVDLAAPARIIRARCDARDGKTRLVIELGRSDAAHFAAAVEAARTALAPAGREAGAEAVAPASGKPIVMIDPGHGGIDHGAAVNGLVEKDLVLAFAQALAAKLTADGRYQPVLTRADDSFVPLNERVRMARAQKVALFVSIHADTLAEAAEVSGATVYTASDRASDAEAARLAEKENGADAAAGLDRSEDAADVSDILFDLTRRETRAYSHVFAHTLLNYWKVAARLNKNPQRSAGFRVLKAPDVPSVLLELGYLSNESDDAFLSSPEWRDKAATRMSEAIFAYFAERGSAPAGADSPTGSIEIGEAQGTLGEARLGGVGSAVR